MHPGFARSRIQCVFSWSGEASENDLWSPWADPRTPGEGGPSGSIWLGHRFYREGDGLCSSSEKQVRRPCGRPGECRLPDHRAVGNCSPTSPAIAVATAMCLSMALRSGYGGRDGPTALCAIANLQRLCGVGLSPSSSRSRNHSAYLDQTKVDSTGVHACSRHRALSLCPRAQC